jgi:hypothetical protein
MANAWAEPDRVDLPVEAPEHGEEMRAAALLIAFVVAKVAVVPFHLWGAAPWAPIALLWQDALVALMFWVVDRGSARTRFSRALSFSYWLLIAYVAINVPVGRALSTPLTMPMLRAAGGPLADSFRMYLTFTNVLLMAAVLATGFLPGAFQRITAFRPTRRRAAFAVAAFVLLAALGPIASARFLHVRLRPQCARDARRERASARRRGATRRRLARVSSRHSPSGRRARAPQRHRPLAPTSSSSASNRRRPSISASTAPRAIRRRT